MIYMVGRGVAFGYRKSAKSRLRCKILRRLGFCLTLRFASPSTILPMGESISHWPMEFMTCDKSILAESGKLRDHGFNVTLG